MANKRKKSSSSKNNKLMQLVLTIVGLGTAVMSFIALLFPFLTYNFTNLKPVDYSLQDWFDLKNNLSGSDKVAGWNLAQIFLIVTLVLVALLAIAMVIKLVINNRVLDLVTILVSALTAIASVTFFIATLVGNSAFYVHSDLLKTTGSYSAGAGVYVLAIMAVLTAVIGVVTALKVKKQ